MSIVRFLLNLLYPPRCIFCGRLLGVDDTAAAAADCAGVANLALGETAAGGAVFDPDYTAAGAAAGNAAAGWEGFLCRPCADGLPWLQNRCPRCANLLGERETVCSYCYGVDYAFAECMALGSYQGELRRALHRFKYYGQRSLAGPLGLLLCSKLARLPQSAAVDFLVPVPLHRQRLLQRGYNQAALLAGVAGKKLGLPVREILVRVKETQSQTGLNRRQRKENLRGAFCCCGDFQPGSRLLLLDDVFTSGATVQEAARVLKKAGAGKVSVAVLARVSSRRVYNDEKTGEDQVSLSILL